MLLAHPPRATRRRAEGLGVAILLTALVALGPLSTDLYLPSLPALRQEFAVDAAAIQLTLSVFLAGFALSQLVYGPLSDRFGRRPALLGGLLIYITATLVCALAPTVEILIGARFLQALGACAGPVVARAIVRDVYGQARAATVLSYMAMAMALAPAMGPILGGVVEAAVGWQANFSLLAIYAVTGSLGVALVLPETNAFRGEAAISLTRISGNYGLLLRERRFLGYVLVVAGAYSGIFAFISGSSFVLMENLGQSPARYGFSFASVVAGYMLGTLISGRLTERLGLESMLRLGSLLGLAGAGLGLGLAMAGLLSLWSVLGPMALFMVGAGLMLPNGMAGAVGPFPRMAGAASALLGFAQMSLAALVGIAVGEATDGSAVPLMAALTGAALLAFAAERLLVAGEAGATAPPG